MEAREARRRWTYAEFARLPSEGSTRYEVIDGEVAVTPAPTGRHQLIVTRLARTISNFVEEGGLGSAIVGPIDVLLSEGDYLEPDLVFLRGERIHLLGDRGVEGPPDLVVEVLSPSTAHRDRGIKLERYSRFQVPEYWVVDPDGSVEVWRLATGESDPDVIRAPSVLRWTPVPGGPTLELDLGRILRE